MAVPHLALLVRVYVQRQRQLLVSSGRGWRPRVLRSHSVACHVELHYGFVPVRRSQRDRSIFFAQLHNCCRTCPCWYIHVREYVDDLGGIDLPK